MLSQRRLELSCRRFGVTFRSHLQGSSLDTEDGKDKFVPKCRYQTTNIMRNIPEERMSQFCDKIRGLFQGPECVAISVTVTTQEQI